MASAVLGQPYKDSSWYQYTPTRYTGVWARSSLAGRVEGTIYTCLPGVSNGTADNFGVIRSGGARTYVEIPPQFRGRIDSTTYSQRCDGGSK